MCVCVCACAPSMHAISWMAAPFNVSCREPRERPAGRDGGRLMIMTHCQRLDTSFSARFSPSVISQGWYTKTLSQKWNAAVKQTLARLPLPENLLPRAAWAQQAGQDEGWIFLFSTAFGGNCWMVLGVFFVCFWKRNFVLKNFWLHKPWREIKMRPEGLFMPRNYSKGMFLCVTVDKSIADRSTTVETWLQGNGVVFFFFSKDLKKKNSF